MASRPHSGWDEREDREYLERLFNEAACDRLARSNREYQQSHAEYIVPLAKLLNITRAERAAWAAGKDLGHYEVEAHVRQLEEQYEAQQSAMKEALGSLMVGQPDRPRALHDAERILRAALSSNPATEASEPGAAIPVLGVSTDDVGCVPGSEASDPASSPHDQRVEAFDREFVPDCDTEGL